MKFVQGNNRPPRRRSGSQSETVGIMTRSLFSINPYWANGQCYCFFRIKLVSRKISEIWQLQIAGIGRFIEIGRKCVGKATPPDFLRC